MEFLEKDLEEIIFNADKDKLAERGLVVNGKLLRQFKIGNYGIADLVSYQRPYIDTETTDYNCLVKGTITVYELKKDTISISSFLQALRYAKGIRQYLTKRNTENLYDIEIILIGKRLDLESSFVYLTDFLCSKSCISGYDTGDLILSLLTYSYGVDGIDFKDHYGYKLINEGF